ncbi:hypothetical protein TNCV_3478111 [Trichonephila clavipes]|nr:hypothetical protein TNCV_3478111 [Trichonephila clavipes]
MLNQDQSADEVKSASQVQLNDVAKNVLPWQKCIVTQGSYFEGGCVSAAELVKFEIALVKIPSGESICHWCLNRKRNGNIKAVQESAQHLLHPKASK